MSNFEDFFFFEIAPRIKIGALTGNHGSASAFPNENPNGIKFILQQECIPVGCAPSAAVAVFGASARGCPGGVHLPPSI